MKRTHIKVRLKSGETKGWSGHFVRLDEPDPHYLVVITGAGRAGFAHVDVLDWELRTDDVGSPEEDG